MCTKVAICPLKYGIIPYWINEGRRTAEHEEEEEDLCNNELFVEVEANEIAGRDKKEGQTDEEDFFFFLATPSLGAESLLNERHKLPFLCINTSSLLVTAYG